MPSLHAEIIMKIINILADEGDLAALLEIQCQTAHPLLGASTCALSDSYGASPITTIQFLRLFPKLTIIDFREGVIVNWTELHAQPLPLIRLRWAGQFAEEDEALIMNTSPGLHADSLNLEWDHNVNDLIDVFSDNPWFWNVDTLIIQCGAVALDWFFENLINMQTELNTLYCKCHTSLKPLVRFENIEYLPSLQAFGMHLLDTDTDHILARLCELALPDLYMISFSYAITGPSETLLEHRAVWTRFRDVVMDVSRFPALTDIDIDIYGNLGAEDIHIRMMWNNLIYLFSFVDSSRITVNVHTDNDDTTA
ncbi:uncharacterized protein EV420DRAFT_1487399 [Desarmillaria tabescens]|uniref:Uncharacterized protein n=1 Tax=Armillaria tabescens TaxID=1929756 RepID=A0AA39MK59_ARMTA|nr:uncharacterized protein EV420DRAFT_1487399 [Desarmillaria tabescens]KAK0436848.1 hypothetical protein EV420DRAFT_1487399 [Desarmillaria tabescens]